MGTSSASRPEPERQPSCRMLDSVDSQPIRWLSRGRLAAGKLTILEGAPGLGKSTFICEWAARVSRGEALPDGEPGPPGNVLILAGDNLADVIRPRLDAAGADLTHISAIVCDPDRPHDAPAPHIPRGLPFIAQIMRFVEATLVIIDPFTSLLDRPLNPDRECDVRRALEPLAGVAARSGAAMLLTCHPAKQPSQTAHCNLLLAPDPDEPSLRILAFTRGNLTPPPPALAFRLEPVPGADVARVAMLGESTRTTEELINVPGPEARTERDAAKAWLNELLADGPLAARKVEDLAKRAGFAPQTLRRARENLGIVSKRIGIGAGSSYLWSLSPAQETVAS